MFIFGRLRQIKNFYDNVPPHFGLPRVLDYSQVPTQTLMTAFKNPNGILVHFIALDYCENGRLYSLAGKDWHNTLIDPAIDRYIIRS
jgi:hypothetical protein